ncbi:hypothetical protein ABZS78_41225, partial [Streptomyces decoyicus]
ALLEIHRAALWAPSALTATAPVRAPAPPASVAPCIERNHVQRVLEKLKARSQLEAVTIARREGLLK